MGFFTDTTTCIGCKACEVACKQWNDLPAEPSEIRAGASYDNTRELGSTTWRHVRFLELLEPSPIIREEAEHALEAFGGGHLPGIPAAGGNGGGAAGRGPAPRRPPPPPAPAPPRGGRARGRGFLFPRWKTHTDPARPPARPPAAPP